MQAYGSAPESGSDTLAWDRAKAVGDYLIKRQDISSNRFVLRFDSPIQDAGIITLDGMSPDGLPSPYPHSKLHKRS